jgi:hypothetical protein
MKRKSKSEAKRWLLQAKHDLDDANFSLEGERFNLACTEIEHTGDIVSSLSLKFNTLISIVPIKEKDWLKRKTSLISNIRRDGVAV